MEHQTLDFWVSCGNNRFLHAFVFAIYQHYVGMYAHNLQFPLCLFDFSINRNISKEIVHAVNRRYYWFVLESPFFPFRLCSCLPIRRNLQPPVRNSKSPHEPSLDCFLLVLKFDSFDQLQKRKAEVEN